jgi:hypothetical protein
MPEIGAEEVRFERRMIVQDQRSGFDDIRLDALVEGDVVAVNPADRVQNLDQRLAIGLAGFVVPGNGHCCGMG